MTRRKYNKMQDQLHQIHIELIDAGVSNQDVFKQQMLVFDTDYQQLLKNEADVLLSFAEDKELFEICQKIKDLKEKIN